LKPEYASYFTPGFSKGIRTYDWQGLVKELNAKANQRGIVLTHRAFRRNPFRESTGVKKEKFEWRLEY